MAAAFRGHSFLMGQSSMANDNLISSLILRRADACEVLPLRKAVLIEGTTGHTEHFSGDDSPSTRHYVALLSNKVVCCLSLMISTYDGVPAWQLRGMATEPDFSGKGVGTALLAHAEDETFRETQIPHFWCNSQARSERFYQKNGWVTASLPFFIEGVCEHVKMHKSKG